MQFYINENLEIYFVDQILINTINDELVIIKKFINHHHRNKKGIYLCVNLQSVKYKTKDFTVPVDLLGDIYKKREED